MMFFRNSNRMQVDKMGCLRSVNGITKYDRVESEAVQQITGVQVRMDHAEVIRACMLGGWKDPNLSGTFTSLVDQK